MSARAALVPVVACGALLGCRTPTQITVSVYTDVACEADHPQTSITVGRVGSIDDATRAPVTVVTSTTCNDGRIGALVVVPSGAKDDELAIRVVTGIGKGAEECAQTGYTGGCIVARRALHFVPHESLDLPIDMRLRCRDVPCDSTKTCVDGTCVSSTVVDPGSCHGDGCRQDSLVPKSDGGVVDATVDGGADVSLDADASGPAIEYGKSTGPRAVDLQSDVAVDADGNLVVASSFTGSTNVDKPRTSAGFHDGLLTKISRGGVVRWAKQLGGTQEDFALAVAIEPTGNILVAGYSDGDLDLDGASIKDTGTSDLFLARYDRDGNYLGAKRFMGGSKSDPVGLAVDASGIISFAGNAGSDVQLGGPLLKTTTNDIFLARLAPDFSHLGSKLYGGTKDDFLYGFAPTKDGGVVLVGAANGAIDFGDGPRTPVAGYDMFVARIGSDLGTRWSHMYGGASDDVAHAVTVDDTDRAVLAGFFSDGADFGAGAQTGPAVFVVGLDAAGNHAFGKTFTSGYNDWVNAITTDATGRITLGGYLVSSISFGGPTLTAPTESDLGDVFLAQLDASGGYLKSMRFGDATARQQIIDLAIDRPTGAIAMTGAYGGTLALPFQRLTTSSFEGFVARMFP